MAHNRAIFIAACALVALAALPSGDAKLVRCEKDSCQSTCTSQNLDFSGYFKETCWFRGWFSGYCYGRKAWGLCNARGCSKDRILFGSGRCATGVSKRDCAKTGDNTWAAKDQWSKTCKTGWRAKSEWGCIASCCSNDAECSNVRRIGWGSARAAEDGELIPVDVDENSIHETNHYSGGDSDSAVSSAGFVGEIAMVVGGLVAGAVGVTVLARRRRRAAAAAGSLASQDGIAMAQAGQDNTSTDADDETSQA